MTRHLLIRGGRLIDPLSGVDEMGDLLIADGVIAELLPGGGITAPTGTEVFEAVGLVVTPGFVDLHAHLREPGFEEKETIATGTRAAAQGGFTTVCCMPNTDPAIDSLAALDFVMGRAAAEGVVRVLPVGAVSKQRKGVELVEMGELVEGGAVAFSDDGSPVLTPTLLRSALAYAQALGVPIMDHCEEPTYVGCSMHEGRISTRLGLRGQPAAAEEMMVARGIQLAELTGGHFHVAHMSTLGAIELVRRAKERGLRVTAEVTPHHLTLTDEWVAGGQKLWGVDDTIPNVVAAYDTNTKVNPPLRPRPHVEAMIEGLADGTIDAIATDHAPHAIADKLCEYDAAAYGISGFETALATVLTLVHSGRVPLGRAVAALTEGPARVLGSNGADLGTLKNGGLADVTILDPNREWVVDSQAFASMGKNTPLEGHTLRGRVVATVYGGVLVHDERAEAVGNG